LPDDRECRESTTTDLFVSVSRTAMRRVCLIATTLALATVCQLAVRFLASTTPPGGNRNASPQLVSPLRFLALPVFDLCRSLSPATILRLERKIA
jgi:hypothetical protein